MASVSLSVRTRAHLRGKKLILPLSICNELNYSAFNNHISESFILVKEYYNSVVMKRKFSFEYTDWLFVSI